MSTPRRSRVRKHRAPKDALRDLLTEEGQRSLVVGQKALSAKKCIETLPQQKYPEEYSCTVRKHRAPKGALRLPVDVRGMEDGDLVRKHRAP